MARASGAGRRSHGQQMRTDNPGARQRRAEGRALDRLVEPASRREAASYVAQQQAMSERDACRLVGVARSTKRYRPRRKDRETDLRQRIRRLALSRPRFGYRRLGAMLAREGEKVNHKRMYRLYRLEGQVVRRRRRKRLARGTASRSRRRSAAMSAGRWISSATARPAGEGSAC